MLTATVGKSLITKGCCKRLRTHSRRSERPKIMGVWRCRVSLRCGIRNKGLDQGQEPGQPGHAPGSRKERLAYFAAEINARPHFNFSDSSNLFPARRTRLS